ncbi:MAG: mannose-1-phosphate guanylyltransferase/mannose-6-phosphate isomerase [Waddliaceae bacterium]|jgi:mannose-1-phosphate guanylyltransferase / mannose-6-phosphate isomerase|nr:mannose-1-phosphate guanylyltransferase/mannose-6-phosphate isomerase [Waddliaceae bacterium]MBT3579633.1 mannose-1-phosphate guanylyltransferase/mannose-6-phosphate isomerase [Waddliaceae bacterium]MBT4445218.1 mannose-1-phosphate guanylyltransferase/mannose-6-phosphate isomerase [Waddliaceae bacterium]MBT6928122.1 mannose-1-phosphate guanylyltransferase/mannose-6-phosphate isomerase [Waddliaceae bacterium]MBT7264683.1 mannose-1-phosphate guanylyltransferase/mannose-6-phosphate isomerase [W
MKTIILAGGCGTRLWPLSRKSHPKQFLHIDGQPSLFQKTIQRQLKVCDAESIFVVTNSDYRDIIVEQMRDIADIPNENVIVEPIMRNTAPAIALATKYVVERGNCNDDEPVVVVTSDHHIEPEDRFAEAVIRAGSFAEKGHIVIFGIQPTHPETGYGYIKEGDAVDDSVYVVDAFVEKPDSATAEKYLSEGCYLWNSGMFIFTPATMLAEMKKHCNEIYERSQKTYDEMYSDFPTMPKISIDYAVMEKAQNVLVLPLDITWSDIGSYDSYYEFKDKDDNGNVAIGDVIACDTKNSLIIGSKRTIATIGLDNIIIVETDDALLIAQRGHSQKVKDVVERLQKADSNKL